MHSRTQFYSLQPYFTINMSSRETKSKPNYKTYVGTACACEQAVYIVYIYYIVQQQQTLTPGNVVEPTVETRRTVRAYARFFSRFRSYRTTTSEQRIVP